MAIQHQHSEEILVAPKLKQGQPLSPGTIDMIKSFYMDDNNSFLKILPGKKFC